MVRETVYVISNGNQPDIRGVRMRSFLFCLFLLVGCSADGPIIYNKGEPDPVMEYGALDQRCLIVEDCKPVSGECFRCGDGAVSCPGVACTKGYCVLKWTPDCK